MLWSDAKILEQQAFAVLDCCSGTCQVLRIPRLKSCTGGDFMLIKSTIKNILSRQTNLRNFQTIQIGIPKRFQNCHKQFVSNFFLFILLNLCNLWDKTNANLNRQFSHIYWFKWLEQIRQFWRINISNKWQFQSVDGMLCKIFCK